MFPLHQRQQSQGTGLSVVSPWWSRPWPDHRGQRESYSWIIIIRTIGVRIREGPLYVYIHHPEKLKFHEVGAAFTSSSVPRGSWSVTSYIEICNSQCREVLTCREVQQHGDNVQEDEAKLQINEAGFSETWICIHQTTWNHIQEDNNLNI